jgi:phospholipid/cholesterol/gamma-HCH transport system substrate-binding protein
MRNKVISTEIKVGMLVLVGVIILLYMSIRVEKFGFLREEEYDLVVTVDDASGLDNRTPVYIAGVQVGYIKKIALDGYRARAQLSVKKGVNIPRDSKIAIKSQGLLGDKYLEIMPGGEKRYLAQGDRISGVVTTPGFDQLFARIDGAAKDFSETMGQFKEVIGDKEKVNIQKTLDNMEVATADFKELLEVNKEDVNRVVSNATNISDKLETIVNGVAQGKGTLGLLVKDEALYNDAKATVASLKTISDDVAQGKGSLGRLMKDESIYTEAKETLSNMRDLTEGIKDGKGTLGKLVKDESLYVETERAMKKLQKGAEGLQEMTPISILGTIFGMIF